MPEADDRLRAPAAVPPLGVLRQIVIAVDEIEPAVRLFRDELGLPLKFSDEGRWAAFDLCGLTLAVAGPGQHPDAGAGARAVITLAAKVPDLTAAVAAIAAADGATCGETVKGPHELRVSCRHSSGVPLVLYQSLAEPTELPTQA